MKSNSVAFTNLANFVNPKTGFSIATQIGKRFGNVVTIRLLIESSNKPLSHDSNIAIAQLHSQLKPVTTVFCSIVMSDSFGWIDEDGTVYVRLSSADANNGLIPWLNATMLITG